MLENWKDRTWLTEHYLVFSDRTAAIHYRIKQTKMVFPVKLVFQQNCVVEKISSNQSHSDFKANAMEKSILNMNSLD